MVDNRPGASGNLGTDAVAKAAPDGTTIGISILGPLGLNTLLFAKMPYDPFTDLALVTRLTDMPSVLAVNADVPARTTRGAGRAAEARARQVQLRLDRQRLAVASGDGGDRAQERHAARAHSLWLSPQAVTALIRGDVQIVCLPAISVVSQVQTGKVRMLAVTSPKRSPLLPDLPTLQRSRHRRRGQCLERADRAGEDAGALIAAIAREVNEALRDRGIREKLHAQYMEPLGTSPAEFKAFLDAEMRRWTPVVRPRRSRRTRRLRCRDSARSARLRGMSGGAIARDHFTSFTPVTFSRFL